MSIKLTGANLVAGTESRLAPDTYRSVDATTGQAFGPPFHDATDEEVAAAAAEADAAFATLRRQSQQVIVRLLHAIADHIEGLGDALTETADAETGLGRARIVSERRRACGQLRAFADVVAEGSYVEARIDTAEPEAQPPRPDLRRMQIPIGPVAVFGASNFPLAFSTPGGDTASALAAGCPVVVKAHPSHPATSELCGRAIARSLADVDLPAGTFSLLHGRDVRVGRSLVLAPQIKAVGFTGSHTAGRALFELGASRPEPIPVYAEMGSLNPVFVTGGALAERGEQIADAFVQSMTLGTGQFCTKPGLLFLPDNARAFEERVVARLRQTAPGVLLNQAIRNTLMERLSGTTTLDGVEVLSADDGDGNRCGASLLATSAEVYRRTPELGEEHFGPVSVLVRCGDRDEMRALAEQLGGSLTATVHAEPGEEVGDLLDALGQVAGRVIWNGFPTGVAVTHAMHHGGPYPATTFPAHTSVGSAAIRRFLRPVAYQDMPQRLLPPALHDDNPLQIMRMINGRMTSGPVS